MGGLYFTREHLNKFARPFLSIRCGEWTYGAPLLELAENDYPRTIEIGRYCSIGPETRIHVGRYGRHPVATLTSYPLNMVVSPQANAEGDKADEFPDLFVPPEDLSKASLDVEIGHDVWIGTRVIILAGVKIGTGAVIAAGAVVSKDVAPYEIVGGVPAKHMRYRHDAETVAKLLASRWWERDPDEIWRACGSLFRSIRVTETLNLLAGPADSVPADGRLRDIKPDLSNASDVLSGLDAEGLYEAFSDPRLKGLGLPQWPEEAIQKQYTGNSGVALVARTTRFIDALEREGEFATSDWHGLDFGVGWGRIASCMLRHGRPEQLDICDAWQRSLDLAAGAGLRNHAFLVGETLRGNDIETGKYDFIYAFSIFTHLSPQVFLPNLEVLLSALKPGGRLYFTVRHEDFSNHMEAHLTPDWQDRLASAGIFHVTYPNQAVYGETIVTKEFVANGLSTLGSLRYLGLVDALQHLYQVIPAQRLQPDQLQTDKGAPITPEPETAARSAAGLAAAGGNGQALVIIGPHRSGTSAMARALSLLGWSLPRTLVPGGPGNVEGHFESLPVMRFDEEHLRKLDREWLDPKPLPEAYAATAGDIASAAALLESEYGGAPRMVIKEPRMSRLLPLWRKAFAEAGIAPFFILASRDAWAVADSLARRDGFGVEHGLELWLAYILEAELATRGLPRRVLRYEDLQADPAAALSLALGGLGLDVQPTNSLRQAVSSVPALEAPRASSCCAPAYLARWVARIEAALAADPELTDPAPFDAVRKAWTSFWAAASPGDAASFHALTAAETHFGRSTMEFAAGRPFKALQAARIAATLAPKNPVFLLQRGKMAAAIKQHIEAERTFRAVLAIDPAEVTALHELGLLMTAAGREAEARDLFAKAATFRPAN